MRKIVSGLFITLDGVAQAPNEWQFDNFDEDMMGMLNHHMTSADTALLGRVTYQEWADYWSTSTDEPYASYINTIPKYVVSTTLDKVAWGKWDNAHLIKGNLPQELELLRQQPGKNISINGSPTLVRSLMNLNLLDELTLMIHPVVAGHGKRLFEGTSELKRLKLTSSTTTRTGVVVATYQTK